MFNDKAVGLKFMYYPIFQVLKGLNKKISRISFKSCENIDVEEDGPYIMSLVMRKPAFCICENKDADQLRGNTAKLICVFVFATRIIQFPYFLYIKF